MRGIPYRIVVPFFQLALYLLLTWYGCLYQQTWQVRLQHWITSRPVAADAFIPTWVDGAPSLPEQLGFGINAPAAFASALVLIPLGSLFHDGASKELADHAATAFFIPVLWYFIGR